MNEQNLPSRQAGFTLIEIMIALVIVGILVSIAVPAYTNQQVKARRSDCMATMLAFAQAMEKYYAVNFSYTGAAKDDKDTGEPDSSLFPAQCPTSGSAYYTLTIESADATSFQLQAEPVSGTSQDGDGVIEIASTGRRGWDHNGDKDTTDTDEGDWEI